jgi:predicted ATP-dependent protease
VVVESFPDPSSLFGTIDRVMVENKPYSDHTMISAGSYLKANGGFLILDAMDVVRYPGLWQTLSQTLKNRTAVIRATDMMRLFGAVELQPEPIEVNVKVIMIGRYGSICSSPEATPSSGCCSGSGPTSTTAWN